jgi:hypothetical protein
VVRRTSDLGTDITGADSTCCRVGNWIFYEIVDNAEPGVFADVIFGEDLTAGEGITNPLDALGKVTSHTQPAGGPFIINDGNMQVH